MTVMTAQIPENPQKRLRVAVLNRNFSPRAGGAERYSLELVRLLAEKHEMHVFAQTIEHPGSGPLPGVVYHQVSMPMRRPRWVNQLWQRKDALLGQLQQQFPASRRA